MGQKVNPKSLRLTVSKRWVSRWFDQKHFADNVVEDIHVREAIAHKFGPTAGVGLVEIERDKSQTTLYIHTSKPGIIIGRSGKGLEDLRTTLTKQFNKKFKIEIIEIKKGDIDATVVAQSIGHQIEKRINYRRAGRQAVDRAMQAGAKGIKIIISGRLRGADIARSEKFAAGLIPLANLRTNIDFGLYHAKTTYGVIGIKVWMYTGDLVTEEAHHAAAA